MRLVSLCPSLTELVFDLGAGEELVGRTKFCVHPQSLVERVEKVGGTKNPKIARILELHPDLVLMNEEENRLEDAEQLEAAGINVHSSIPRTAAETAEMVRSIAAAIHREESGERIAVDIETRAERVRTASRSLAPLTYAYLIWREPWMTINDDTFVAALVALAGGRNVFGATAERYPTITLDDLRVANPEVILLSSEPFRFAHRHAVELEGVLGFPRDRFEFVDGELLSWHGSRTPRGIDYAADVVDTVRRRLKAPLMDAERSD